MLSGTGTVVSRRMERLPSRFTLLSRNVPPKAGLLLALLLVLIGALVLSTLPGVEYRDRADEGVYLGYARRIASRGIGAFPGLLDEYLQAAPASRWFPHPLRLTPILLGAAVSRCVGGASFGALSLLSLLSFLALVAVTAVGLRWMAGPRAAVWATLIVAVSPLHLGLARRALSDTLGSLLFLGSLWAFLWAMEWPKGKFSRWWVVACLYAAAFLAKESSFLLIPVSVGWLVWSAVRRRHWPAPSAVCAVSIFPLALAGLALLLAVPDPGRIGQVARLFASGADANAYAQQYQNGPWFRFLVDFMLVSPWPVLLYVAWIGLLLGAAAGAGGGAATRLGAAAGAGGGAATRLGAGRQEERIWFWILVPVVVLGCAALFPYGKNVRFVIAMEVPIRICAALFLLRMTRSDGRGSFWPAARMAGIVLPLLWLDLQSFFTLFVQGGVYDPVSLSLLELRRFLPG